MHDSWTSSFFFSLLLSPLFTRSFVLFMLQHYSSGSYFPDRLCVVSLSQSCGAVLAQLGGLFLVSIAGNAHGGERGHTKLAVGGPPDAWPKARRDGAYSM